MDANELSYWLALLHCPGIGTIRTQALISYFQTPQAILEAVRSGQEHPSLPLRSRNWLKHPDWSAVEKDLQWLSESPDHHIIHQHSDLYPKLLKETATPPPLLFVKGNLDVLNMPQLAIVGSRNPSAGGTENAFQFAKSLSQGGFTITSGLAIGIDTAAHKGALHAQGLTIAVTGTGLDRVYPARNRQMAHEIVTSGALVSELPIGTPPLAENFPRRNRIISGLSLGTLVVEAAPRSGSLITARLANEEGREVFAIPGSIHNPLAKGCHELIRQGAKLAETEQDILSELGSLIQITLETLPAKHSEEISLPKEQQIIIDTMGHDPVSIDSLVERSHLTAEEVSSILLVLELQGMVCSTTGGLYSRLC